MEDSQIIKLYFDRDEDAIARTSEKYGNYCHTIAYNILHNPQDSEECVNDTYLKVWEIVPPQQPKKFAAFLGKITRNIALDFYRRYSAKKRGNGEMQIVLDELSNCIPDSDGAEDVIDRFVLTEIINSFLSSLSEENRKIFVRRYWYVSSIKEIANEYGLSESKVKMSLLRSRNQFRELLEKEDIAL